VAQRRTELLVALLTIWRWGRLEQGILGGRTLGSFEQWCRWVRDPLLALGCQDPVERISEAKQRDSRRQALSALFAIWWERHRDQPVAVSDLHEDVRHAADPQGRGRQYLAAYLEKLDGTRMAGFVLTRQAPAGKWGVATFSLKQANEEERHRGHRGHRPERSCPNRPMTPMTPMLIRVSQQMELRTRSVCTHAPYGPYAFAGFARLGSGGW
jgi:hypothetical protein